MGEEKENYKSKFSRYFGESVFRPWQSRMGASRGSSGVFDQRPPLCDRRRMAFGIVDRLVGDGARISGAFFCRGRIAAGEIPVALAGLGRWAGRYSARSCAAGQRILV